VSTTAVIVLGFLIWIVMAVLFSLFVARMSSRRASAAKQSPVPPVGKPFRVPDVEVMARCRTEPVRFVGRAEMMAAASTALAPASGRTAVVFHGMAGMGKTTCAVELAHRHQRDFVAVAFWSAPTDADQFGDALRLLAVALEGQLKDHGFAIVDKIATLRSLEDFLPTLTPAFADAGLLLILDNLETLLTPDGQWRDFRWASLIGALTYHQGPSRVILTSRDAPAGLNPDMVLIQPVHALSRDESLLLVRELPNLRALLQVGSGTVNSALGRSVFTLAQGHPKLLELADAAAAEPSRLAFQLAEVQEAVERVTFFTKGDTELSAEQLLQTFTAWIITVAATLPAPARLLLQVLCQIEETDRNTAIISVNWAALWRRLDQPDRPPPLASLVASLITAALIATDPMDDPADPDEPVRYRIHPGVVETILAATPEPVTAAVDTQLAAWWTAVAGGWEAMSQQAGKDTSQIRMRASLAAARYLLRQHDWHAASCILERALLQNGYSPVTALAVIPLLRRIAMATGALKDLVVLGAAVRKVDPDEAETLLRRAYDQATTNGEYQLASTTAGELITLLRDQGKLADALTLAGKKIEHTSRARFGSWTQISDRGRRLQILNMLGRHDQVLIDLRALRTRMAELPDQRADNDRVNPWNVREGVLDIGRLSAVALERWDDALDLNDEIVATKRRRGASSDEIARTRFNDYIPLLRRDRLTDVDQLLRDCQDAFDTGENITQLAMVYGARAHLEDKRDRPAEAVELQRTSLRLWYVRPDPQEISMAHHNLANYLSRTGGNPAEQRAHRLTASLLNHLTGNTAELTRTLGALASELRSETSGPDAQVLPATLVLPTTLAGITRVVDADNGVRFGNLVAVLCPDPAAVERALADLLATATIPVDEV
jgi:tetratricopeptide (TPR) repeat protein